MIVGVRIVFFFFQFLILVTAILKMGDDDEYMKLMEIQRRNFETQFGSLTDMGFKDKFRVRNTGEMSDDKSDEVDEQSYTDDSSDDRESENSDDSSESDDSDSKDVRNVLASGPKIVKLTDSFNQPPRTISKADKKLLRSGRAPTLSEIDAKEKQLSKLTAKQSAKAAQEDSENLENDVKLQRLLQESHILADQLEYSGADLTLQTIDYEDPTGKARKKALDSRMRTISALNSSTGGLPKKLEKMPMKMRKGMIKTHEQRVKRYEEEAKNAGIVLSKVKKGQIRDLGKTSNLIEKLGTTAKSKAKRQRGLKIHSIGKSTRNGLVIAQADIDRINNKGKHMKSKKRR